MNSTSIIVIAIVLALLAYVCWLFSSPGEPKPLIPEEKDKALLSLLPEDTSSGNDVTTFTEFFPMVEQIIEDIDKATDYIHMSFFKFEDDPVGRRIEEHLAKKAAEGLDVRVMVDFAVNMLRGKLYKDMRNDGIKTRIFSPMYIPFLRKSDNYRYHRKIVAIDGQVAYIGGMNIAEHYGSGLSWGCWRDTHIRIDGPAAARCEYYFARDWAHKRGELLSDSRFRSKPVKKGDVNVDVVCSGPKGEGPEVMRRICKMLDDSTRYAWLESPYLIPTKEIKESVFNAARRGVDVRIIYPCRGDHGILTPLASDSYAEEFMDAGVKVAQYQIGYMHSKAIVCDDRFATVGSTNIDPRSYCLDYEVNAFIEDPVYVQELKSAFLTDEASSVYLDAQEWKNRSHLKRAMEAVAKSVSVQL